MAPNTMFFDVHYLLAHGMFLAHGIFWRTVSFGVQYLFEAMVENVFK
jgi:hypothetical protein